MKRWKDFSAEIRSIGSKILNAVKTEYNRIIRKYLLQLKTVGDARYARQATLLGGIVVKILLEFFKYISFGGKRFLFLIEAILNFCFNSMSNDKKIEVSMNLLIGLTIFMVLFKK